MAFYSDRGSMINQAVGSIESTPEAIQAFHDGVFGGRAMYEDPASEGRLVAYDDGVLGGDGPMNGLGSDLHAYDNGVLGMNGPLYIDGRLVQRPVTIQHMAGAGCSGCGALGAPAALERDAWAREFLDKMMTKGVIDLSNPEMLYEVKKALTVVTPNVAQTPEGKRIYDDAWAWSGNWGAKSSELAQAWLDGVRAAKISPFADEDLVFSAGKVVYPLYFGIVLLSRMLQGAGDVDDMKLAQDLPIMVVLAQMHEKTAPIKPAKFIPPIVADGNGGPSSPVKASTLAIGLLVGSALAGGLYLAFKKR